MTGTRTAMALYVAFALHLVALLMILLLPAPRALPGPGRGMGIGLQLAGEMSVLTQTSVQATTNRGSDWPEKSGARIRSRSELGPTQAPRSAISSVVSVADLRRETSAHEVPPSGSAAVAMHHEQANRVGMSGGASKAGGGGVDRYFARLRAHLQAFRRELPRATGSGQAEVRFTVSAEGRVLAMSLLGSSGSPELDAEALDLIRRAEPLPRPPEGRSLELAVPIVIE